MGTNYVRVPGTYLVRVADAVMAQLAYYRELEEAAKLDEAYNSDENTEYPSLWGRLFRGEKPTKIYTKEEIKAKIDEHSFWFPEGWLQYVVEERMVYPGAVAIADAVEAGRLMPDREFVLEVKVANAIAELAAKYNKRVNNTNAAEAHA